MTDTALTAVEVAQRTAQPILELARGWLLSKDTARRGEELGLLPGRGFWTLGRAGVLGDVDADLAAAAVGFMEPAHLRTFWESRPTDLSPGQVAAEYAGCCAAWARTALAAVPEDHLARLNQLARTVADAALPVTGALFTGWRALPQPDDPPAAAALSLHVLRELRGGAHLTAVLGSGMSPLDAVMSAPPPRGGATWAADLGWPEPYPDPAGLADRRAAAEKLTTQLVAPAYEALAPEERSEFVDLVLEARAAC